MLDLDCLFPKCGLPIDRTESLQAIAELLVELAPGLQMLARSDGQAIAVDAGNSELDPHDVARLEETVVQRLAARRFDTWPMTTQFGQRLAYGVRLPYETRGAILVGVVAIQHQAVARLEQLASALVVTGRLVWRVIERQSALERVEARNKQLIAEYDTLRAAHAAAVTQALDAQQKSVEAQRLHSLQLQKEVAERSAALRAAMEEAQLQKEELERYSAALQSTNQALEEFSHAAEAASRAKSEFLANMSHELRTPLTAILGHCEIMQEDLAASESFQEPLAVIERNGRHLLHLINDVLDLAKIEAGKLELDRVPCSPLEMMFDLERMFMPRVHGKPVELRVVQRGSLPVWIETDPTRLQQILMNLLSNAVKFTTAGKVTLCASYQHDPVGRVGMITYTVADTGVGIPADKLAKVFEPFEQADTSTARQFGGTGLGLSICKRLAEGLGGRIEAESRVGEGSTFTLVLPVVASSDRVGREDAAVLAHLSHHAAASAAPPPQAAADESLRARVLLAEDSLDNRRLISTILTRAGATVTVVENGQEALDLLLSPSGESAPTAPAFDLILMDMQMPVLDGYHATRRLRESGYTIPIVALTAHAMKGDRELCLQAGCDDYATKPINKARLLEVLRKQLHAPAVH